MARPVSAVPLGGLAGADGPGGRGLPTRGTRPAHDGLLLGLGRIALGEDAEAVVLDLANPTRLCRRLFGMVGKRNPKRFYGAVAHAPLEAFYPEMRVGCYVGRPPPDDLPISFRTLSAVQGRPVGLGSCSLFKVSAIFGCL
jgi:hypothetical protein